MQATPRKERESPPRRKPSMSRPSFASALAEAVVPSRPLPSLRPFSPTHTSPLSQRSVPADVLVKGLFVVYDADGTPAGEFIYMVKKLVGLGHCAACDITHGPRKEKPEFTQLKKARGWGVPLLNIHRDEMDESLAAAVGTRLPCVVARTEARNVLLLGQEALVKCDGDVGRFQELVDLALKVHKLVAPSKEIADWKQEMDMQEMRTDAQAARQIQMGSYGPFPSEKQTAQMEVHTQGEGHMQVMNQMFVKQKQLVKKWDWRMFETSSEMQVDDDAVVPGSRS